MNNQKHSIILKFVNQRIKNGKKSKAEKILFQTLKECEFWIKNSNKQKNMENKGSNHFPTSVSGLILEAIQNVQPRVEIRSVKIRGRNYQVPVPVDVMRSQALAIKWIVLNAKSRKEKHMHLRLSNELIESCQGLSKSTLKCEQIHKRAESNRIFAHFRL